MEKAEDFMERVQCGVIDGPLKEERCCSLERAHPGMFDWFGWGFVGEKNTMTEYQYKEVMTKRFLTRVLYISIFIFAIIGLSAVLFPEYVVFNYAITDSYREQLGINDEWEQQERELANKKKKDESVTKMLDDAMDSIGHLFLSNNEADAAKKKAEIDLTIQKLKQARENLIYTKPESVSMTAPTRMLGGALCFYVFFCISHLRLQGSSSNRFLNQDLVNVHSYWFMCGIIAATAASVGHGNGLATSWLMILLIVVNITGFIVYQYIYQKVVTLQSMATPTTIVGSSEMKKIETDP
jgi:hypothetical protein